MQPVGLDGRAPASADLDALRGQLHDARARCQRQALDLDRLAGAMSAFRRANAALKAENAELRAANDQTRHAGRAAGHAVEARLALDAQAPAGARRAVTDILREHVTPRMLEHAQLVASELVTNSLCHSGAPAGEDVVVRVRLTPAGPWIEVEDAGSDGVVAPREPDLLKGDGFGLHLVEALSGRWGVERAAGGGTRVWALLSSAAAA